MSGKFIDKAKRLKQDIDVTNMILTVLDYNTANVKLVHETSVYRKYLIDYVQNAKESHIEVQFNGWLVYVTENGNIYTMEAMGYMGMKLKLVRHELDKKIKAQNKAEAKAANKIVWAQKRTEKMMKLRKKLSERVFGDNSL